MGRSYLAETWAAFDDDLITLMGAVNEIACPEFRRRWGTMNPPEEVWVFDEIWLGGLPKDGNWAWRVMLFVPVPGTDEILGYYAVGRLEDVREWSENLYGVDHRRRVDLRRAMDKMEVMVNKYGMSLEEIQQSFKDFMKEKSNGPGRES